MQRHLTPSGGLYCDSEFKTISRVCGLLVRDPRQLPWRPRIQFGTESVCGSAVREFPFAAVGRRDHDMRAARILSLRRSFCSFLLRCHRARSLSLFAAVLICWLVCY